MFCHRYVLPNIYVIIVRYMNIYIHVTLDENGCSIAQRGKNNLHGGHLPDFDQIQKFLYHCKMFANISPPP